MGVESVTTSSPFFQPHSMWLRSDFQNEPAIAWETICRQGILTEVLREVAQNRSSDDADGVRRHPSPSHRIVDNPGNYFVVINSLYG
jgi:hypothetical protein